MPISVVVSKGQRWEVGLCVQEPTDVRKGWGHVASIALLRPDGVLAHVIPSTWGKESGAVCCVIVCRDQREAMGICVQLPAGAQVG